jgi:hypothetical protein
MSSLFGEEKEMTESFFETEENNNTGISVEDNVAKFISNGEEITWSEVVTNIGEHLGKGESAQQELEEIRKLLINDAVYYNPDLSVLENVQAYIKRMEDMKELREIEHLDD